MPTNILVPALGESVIEATVGKWLKREGDAVTAGEPLVELETDKVNLAVPAEKAGVLSHIERKAGEDVKVGDVLGTVDDSKQFEARSSPASPVGGVSDADTSLRHHPSAMESPPSLSPVVGVLNPLGPNRPASTGSGDSPASPTEPKGEFAPAVADAAPAASAEEKAAPQSDGAAAGTAPAKEQAASKTAGAAGVEAAHHATTLAQRIAAAQGVDVGQLEGSGPGGRVTKDDVQQFLSHQRTERPQAQASVSEPVGGMPPESRTAVRESGELAPAVKSAVATVASAGLPASREPRREERQRLSRRRQTIARRLVEAQHTAAMLTTFNEADMSAVIEIRKRHKDSFAQKHGIKLGFVSFFVKASIGALKAYPRLNAEMQDADIVLKHYYDIGMAIGAEEGLVVPVLRDADRLSFAEIERAIAGYVQKTRDGSLSIEDLRGGTFTITNGGVFGSLMSTPILNPPQVGILGLHKIQERPVALGGQVVIRPMMYVALSYDHRIVDGREAVQFLVRLKELVEDPASLLLEG